MRLRNPAWGGRKSLLEVVEAKRSRKETPPLMKRKKKRI